MEIEGIGDESIIFPTEDIVVPVKSEPSAGQSQASTLSKSQQEQESKDVVLAYLPTLPHPEQISLQDYQEVWTKLEKAIGSFESFKNEVISAMWDSWHKAEAAIAQAAAIAEQRADLQAEGLQGDLLSAMRKEMEIVGAMIAQHYFYGAALQTITSQGKDFMDRLKAQQDLTNNVATFAAKALYDGAFSETLRAHILERLDARGIDGVAREALADKWIAVTRVSIAFSALGLVARTDVAVDGSLGSFDVSLTRPQEEVPTGEIRRALEVALQEDLDGLRTTMTESEFLEFMDNLKRTAALYGENAAGMAESFIIALSQQQSGDVETNRRNSDAV